MATISKLERFLNFTVINLFSFFLNFENLCFLKMLHIFLYDHWVQSNWTSKLEISIKFQYRVPYKNAKNVFVKLFMQSYFSTQFLKYYARSYTMVFIKQNVFTATVADRFLWFVGSKPVEILMCVTNFASLPPVLAENVKS